MIKIFGQIYSIDNPLNINQFLLQKFNISSNMYDIVQTGEISEIRILSLGGKGGFGRAIKREGERRSRRLPRFKDSCRTLGGKRIGVLKARKRIEELKQKIEEKENLKNLNRELRMKSNKDKELELLQERESDAKESVARSIQFAIENVPKERPVIKEESVFTNIDLGDILDESDNAE